MTLAHLLCLMAGYLVGGLTVYRAMRDYRTTVIHLLDPTETRAVIRQEVQNAEADRQAGTEESEPFWMARENGAGR